MNLARGHGSEGMVRILDRHISRFIVCFHDAWADTRDIDPFADNQAIERFLNILPRKMLRIILHGVPLVYIKVLLLIFISNNQ